MSEDERALWQEQIQREHAARQEAERLLDEKSRELIREREQATEMLAEEKFLLQALMDTVPDHVYFKDCDSRIIRIGKAQASLFGLSDPASAVGKTDFDFFTEEHAQQARQDELSIIQTGKALTIEEKETWLDKPDTWVSTTKLPLRDREGRIIGTFGISRDITERRRIEAAMQAQMLELTTLNSKLSEAQSQLLQSEKMASVGQLAAGVAHEINNPIGFISSNLNSLKGQVADLLRVLEAYKQAEPALAEYADLMTDIENAKARADLEFLQDDIVNLVSESLEGVNRVKKIVDNLKDFSRVDTAEWHYANLENGLDSTLNIVWNEVKYKAEVKKVYAGLPEIDCMASQINQVFMNLLVNAAQAIEEKGLITLSTGFDDKDVWIDVADSGRGIKPEHLSKIFDPFFTTKPVGKGTGLGLSLAYGIIQRHHGRLEVSSELDKGTVFHVVLPRKRAAEEAG